jgi:hypothetical protein
MTGSLLDAYAVTVVKVIRISSENRQYEKPDNQERNEKTALLQELVKEIPTYLSGCCYPDCVPDAWTG